MRAERSDRGIREALSVGLARRAVRDAARERRARLREQPARLRAVLDAQPHAKPVLPSGAADPAARNLDRRRILARARASTRRPRPRAPRSGRLDREEHRASAQLRRRAAAVPAAIPRRRRGSHRAADGREGAESRSDRREAARERPDRALRGEKRLRGGALFRPKPAPDLASGALLWVVHGVHPPLRGRDHDRSEAPACGARLLAALRGGVPAPRPKITWSAARPRLLSL